MIIYYTEIIFDKYLLWKIISNFKRLLKLKVIKMPLFGQCPACEMTITRIAHH